MIHKSKGKLLKKHVYELCQKYDNLKFFPRNLCVEGTLAFDANYNEMYASETYSIKIQIPKEYPDIIPTVFETSNKIDVEFHQTGENGLCLGAPLQVYLLWKESPCLLGFVEKLIIPYLFSHAYFKEYSVMPFGELSHGTSGLLQYYREYFQTHNSRETLEHLKQMLFKSKGSVKEILEEDVTQIERIFNDRQDYLKRVLQKR